MTTALIVAIAFLYMLVGLRLQANQVAHANFLESCGLVVWPIMFVIGGITWLWGKATLWLASRRKKASKG